MSLGREEAKGKGVEVLRDGRVALTPVYDPHGGGVVASPAVEKVYGTWRCFEGRS